MSIRKSKLLGFFCRISDYLRDTEMPDWCQQSVAVLLSLWVLVVCRCNLNLALLRAALAVLKNQTDALFGGVKIGCTTEVEGFRRVQ